MAKNKHLTLEERFSISNSLDKQCSFKSIGAEIGNDCTTILKEVRNHRVPKKTGAFGRPFDNCALRKSCRHKKLCPGCPSNRYCWNCKKCSSVCANFVEEKCPRLLLPPYVCNGCTSLESCTLEKWYYQPAAADTEYRLIGYSLFSARNIDLPRKVRYSSRKVKNMPRWTDNAGLAGLTGISMHSCQAALTSRLQKLILSREPKGGRSY